MVKTCDEWLRTAGIFSHNEIKVAKRAWRAAIDAIAEAVEMEREDLYQCEEDIEATVAYWTEEQDYYEDEEETEDEM